MPQPPKFQQSYEHPRAEDVFTDREGPFAIFAAARNAIEANRPKILTFYGIGGQGKSALCDALIRQLKQEEWFSTAYGLLRIHPQNDQQPHAALLDLRLSMGKESGVPFPAFDYVFALYWGLTYPEQSLQDYSKGRMGHVNDCLPDLVKEAIKLSKEFGEVASHSGAIGLSISAFRWLHKKAQEKWVRNKFPLLNELFQEGRLIPPDEILDQLPVFLALDILDHLKSKDGRQVIVFIDEYEQLWSHRELKAGEVKHPVDEAIKELVAECPGVMFVLFSRERLHWEHDHSGWVEDLRDAQHLLGGLSSKDADVFLCKCGVTEPPLRSAIIEGSGGNGPEGCHPELLDLSVTHYLSLKFVKGCVPKPDDFRTGSASLADRRRELVHRFLRGYDDRTFRDTLRYLAAAESFDRQLFEEVVRKKTLFPPSGFDHLVSFSFVQELEEGHYRLHPRMSEVLIDDLLPRELPVIHDFYFRYYDERCHPSTPRAISPDNELALNIAAQHVLALDEARFPDWLNSVDAVFKEGARYRLLQPLYERALAIKEKALGPDYPDVATSLNNIAELHRAQGRYEVARPLYERALAIWEKALGPDHPSVAASLHNIAALHYAQGRYEAALPLYERALKIWEKALGSDHPDVAASLHNIAALHYAQGRYEAALPLYERALKIWEKALGPDHPDVATSLNSIAALHYSQGRYEAALPLCERALAVWEKALGPDHPDVATSLNNIAELHRAQGRYEAALPLYERALAIEEKALGPDHPDVAMSLNGIAALHYAQGRYEAARPLYERALAIWEKALGPDHPDVATSLNNIAALHRAQGRYEAALPLYERALAIKEKALGPDHPDVAMSLNGIAALHYAQGRYEAALPLYERALAIREKALGPDHPDVATSLNNIAALHYSQGRYEAARPLYERALAIWEKALGPDHPDVATSLNNIAALHYSQGRYEAALPLYERALAIREKALGPDHPDVATSRQNLSNCQ